MSSIKNTINLYNLLSNAVQQKGLKMHLNKLDLHNRLILTLNKKIEKFPHNKISDKLGGSLNQNIVFNFNNKNFNKDGLVPLGQGRQLINNKNGGTTRLSITNNVVKIITSFFKGLGCLIARPQFIHKTDKLIVRIFYYQNNFNKNPLFNNNKSNFIFNLFNGTGAAKAQNSAPKSQNFATILREMLGQTKWNKVAQTIFNNNKAINTLELASISKKVFILFIKDLIHLKLSNKTLSIEKALNQLAQRAQKGASGLILAGSHASQGLGAGRLLKNYRHSFSSKRANKKIRFFKNNQLLINLISSTNSESLTRKRTRLSKTFFNKTLLAKLIKKVNYHNNNINFLPRKAESLESKKHILPKELIGKGLLLNPINKKKLDALLAWSNIDLSVDYKTIATALLLLVNNNKIDPEGKNTLNDSRLQNILTSKINKNLTALSTQFADEASKKINFIKKTHSTFLIGTPFNTKITKITNSTLFSIRTHFNQGFMLGLKIINLINKQFRLNHVGLPSLEHKDADKLLMLIKESFKAYNYGLNNNKNGFIPFDLLCTEDNVKKFKLLGSLLTKIFKKNIDLQIIKMHNVGLQENILAKAISENAKFDKSSVLIKKLLRKIAISNASLIQFNKQNKILNNNYLIYNSNLNNIISFFKNLKIKEQGVKLINTLEKEKNNIRFDQLYDQTKKIDILHTNPLVLGKVVGLNIRIAGRLQKEQIKPKQTVKTITIGSLSKERANTTNISSFTSKNKKGTFRLSVKMAHIRTFSSSTKQCDKLQGSLNPNYLTGFTDGEGCFSVVITESKSNKIGWAVCLRFHLVAANNPANLRMLNTIKNFLSIGHVRVEKKIINFVVSDLAGCLKLREHFNKFPLLTYKLVHFQLWSKIIDLMLDKEHLSLEGLLKIVALKKHFYFGLSDKLQSMFPNYKKIDCPIYNPDLTKMNIHWLAGFINADGSFGLYLKNNRNYKLGKYVNMRIAITQNNRSLVVFKEIKKFLGAGSIYSYDKYNYSNFTIGGLVKINSFIEKFKETKLLGAKALDYNDFCKGIALVNTKAHLTKDGLELLVLISKRMNSYRTNFDPF